MEKLNQQLDKQLLQVIVEITKALRRFNDLEKLAFDLDINIAFAGSVRLAEEVGVESSKILRNKTQVDNYFLV
jgi:hypothetical protein